MHYVRFYLIGAGAMGALLVVESAMLLVRAAGPADLAVSLLENIWVVASLVALVLFVRKELPLAVPVSFLVYSVAGWLQGLLMVPQSADLESIRVPWWVCVISIGYGGWLVWGSLRQARRLPRSGVVV